MHVVKEQPAQAGQQPQAPAQAEQGQQKTSGLFWFIVGGVGDAVAMHLIARKMQEYAGGMYSKRAQLQARMQMMGIGQGPTQNPYGGAGGATTVSLDDDEDGGFFG
jgi:hypothetical protein